MDIEIRLPELSEGVASADILEFLVAAGDTVSKDQAIIEVETDKATAEIPSPQTGVITEFAVKTGDTVQVGELLARLTVAQDGSLPPSVAQKEPGSVPAAPAPKATEPSSLATAESQSPATSDPAAAETPAKPPASQAAPPPAPATTRTAKDSAGPLPAGPAIRRLAREVGVDLSDVRGSGEGGRITRNDVLDMVRSANRADHGTESAAIDGASVPGTQTSDEWGPTNVESATRIRKTIAAKMHESWSTVPRVTNFDDADVTELEKIRQASKADYAAKNLRLTTMPFLIKAVAMALRNHPVINAIYDMQAEQVIYRRYVSIGVAVDTPRGLVVPAIRNTDDQSISEIAHNLDALVKKVRDGKFNVEDLRGGTFTISNMGAIGGTYSTPIINLPEVAILLVGRSRKMPVVVDDQIVARLMMPLSLSYDHRLIDGAAAARFLNDVIRYLEEPGRLLLAP